MKKRLAMATVTAVGLVGLVATPAFAQVTVNPKSAPQGSFSELTFRVPTEKSDASTTKVEISFPTDHPIANVSVRPEPGWTYNVENTTLPQPVKTDDGEVTQAVSKITWSGGQIKPGEYADFDVSAGPLPDAPQLTFKAIQTYSNGDIVRWIDEQQPGAGEPDHPAPVLKLTAAAGDTSSTSADSTSSTTEKDKTARTLGVVGIVLGAIGLLAGIGAFATRRNGTNNS